MNMKKFYDTCSILENNEDLTNVVISSKSIEELENIKVSNNKTEDLRYNARQAVKAIKRDNPEVIVVKQECYNLLEEAGLEKSNDNLIIACAYLENKNKNPIEFYSEDYLCQLIANKLFGLTVKSLKETDKTDIYYGYKEVFPTDFELAEFYQDMTNNRYNCLVNEYVILHLLDSDEAYKWNGNAYVSLSYKQFKSRAFGNIKPLDIIQQCAFDTLTNNDITLLFGKAGSGKTTLPLAYIMQGIENRKFNKCHIIFSYDTLKGQKTLGFVKGDNQTKILETGSLGGILASKFGDISEVQRLMATGALDIIPTANLRGIEFSDVVYVTEAQNLDLYTLKTLLQRCKTGTKIILDGDILEQCDTNRGVGLFKMIDVFKGYNGFGCIKLKSNYRNEISELTDKL